MSMVETSTGELTTSLGEDLSVMAVTNSAGGSDKTVRPQGRPELPDGPMNDRVSKLEKQMGRVLGMLDGIQGSLGKIASTNKPRYDRSPSPARRQAPKLACFACGEEGHFAANCPKIRHKSVSWISGGNGEVSCPLSGLNDSGSDPEA